MITNEDLANIMNDLTLKQDDRLKPYYLFIRGETFKFENNKSYIKLENETYKEVDINFIEKTFKGDM